MASVRIHKTTFFGWAYFFGVAMAQMVFGQAVGSTKGFPIITAYSATDLGTDAETYSIVQDTFGVLHFGGKGLLSFDGERWGNTVIPGAYGLLGLDLGPDGRLWVASIGDIGWFDYDTQHQLQFHSLKPYLPPGEALGGEVGAVFAHGKGATFVSTDRVLTWTGDRFEITRMEGTRRLTAFRINGFLYVHYRKEGLYQLTESGLKLIIPQSLIGDTDNPIIWLTEYAPNVWLLTTGRGLLLYANRATQPFAPTVSELLRQGAVTCGAKLTDGRFAFGTLQTGIVVMNHDGSLDQTITGDDGLPGTCITSMYVDREGSLWTTSWSHILRIEIAGKSTVFDSRASLRSQVYYGIAPLDGSIAVSNTSGLMVLDRETRRFSPSPAFTQMAHEIVPTESGLLVAGFRGAWRITNGTATSLHKTIYDVFSISTSNRNSEYIVGESRRIVQLHENGQATVLADNLTAPPTSVSEDHEGNIWFGTLARGIFVIRRGSTAAELATSAYNLPRLEGATYVRKTEDGGIVALAANGGWWKAANSQTFAAITSYPGRPIAGLTQIKNGTLWVIHPAGFGLSAAIARIAINRSAATWSPYFVAGLHTIGQPRSIYAQAGPTNSTILWIGGTSGVLRSIVDSTEASPSPPMAPILHVLTRARGADKAQPITSVLPYWTQAVEFEFAEPDYTRRASLRLQTRIDGMDTDWIPASPDSRRVLTAIRDGKYTFRVRAVAESGVASEPTVFQFEIAPPWWRTQPGIWGECIALAGLAYVGYRMRVRTLHRRNAVLEQKVQERTEELAEASAAKTMFVANMSHDIRNPLNGIIGLALALEDTKLDTHQREMVATLRECTTYLSSLVDDVLDFASIEAGRVELRLGPFAPSELLNSVVTTLKAQAAERGALITIETDPDIPPLLRGDAGRIQQILVNYVSNALKYAGGHIRLAATVAPHSPGEIEFFVADEGAGISEDEQKTLFTKFSRLAGARREHIPGTGLGLASCRLLADFMGGSVGIESSVGHGSRFYLRLPLTIATEAAPVPANTMFAATTVLLVEDTDYNALAATAVLSKLGLTCDRAKNGEEALRMFAEKRHAVVLLDRNLPDMDGTEVAQKMRELETDGIRAVLLAVTAYCTADDRALCLKAGMDAFVGKPLTPDKLRKVLISTAQQMLGAVSSIDAPADARPTAPLPVAPCEVDTTLLEYLADGSEAGLAAQAERFIAALSDAQAQLSTAHASGNLDILGDAAHRVLGHARMVGATALIAVCVELESSARKGDAEAATRVLPQVATEVATLTATLRRRPGVQKV